MSIRPVLLWPDARLSQGCADVQGLDEQLITDMFETMYDAPGRGLAAPQIGVMLRLFVMDVGWKDGDMQPVVCINPDILSASEETQCGPEGCLSMPGVTVEVERHAEIELAFTDMTGSRKRRHLTGFAAICAQHELDHLDGKMHFDRAQIADRADVLKTYEALI